MADEKKSGLSLKKVFGFAAKAGLSIAFGFTILAAFDFVMFHELAEGAFFIESVQEPISEILRADIPIVGASVADGFLGLGKMFGGAAGGVEALQGAGEFTQALTETASAPSAGDQW